jgi:hypothetical protein
VFVPIGRRIDLCRRPAAASGVGGVLGSQGRREVPLPTPLGRGGRFVRASGGAALAACLLGWSVQAQGQAANSSREPRRLPVVETSLGVLSYGTGDDVNCGTGIGLAAGGAVRTAGAWRLGLSGDLLLAGPLVCTHVLPMALRQGEIVESWSAVTFPAAPRVGLRVGRSIGGDAGLEVALNAGLVRGRHQVGRGHAWLWRPWTAAALSAEPDRLPLGLRFEYGYHAVPVRYTRDGVLLHQFHRWRPLIRLTTFF